MYKLSEVIVWDLWMVHALVMCLDILLYKGMDQKTSSHSQCSVRKGTFTRLSV